MIAMRDSDADAAFDQAEWEDEQQRLAAMFSTMYSAPNADDEDSDEDDDEYFDESHMQPLEIMPFMYDVADASDHEAEPKDSLEDVDVIPWRPPNMAAADDAADRSGGAAAELAPSPSQASEFPECPSSSEEAPSLASSLDPAFAAKARRLSPLLRSLLMGDLDPASVSVESLLCAMGRQRESCAQRAAHKDFDVMKVERALSATSCQRLREAVDRERCTVADSVDGLPEHQLRLDRAALKELVGSADYERLMSLPVDYVHTENAHLGGEAVDAGVAARFGRLDDCFVRRYSTDTRPWNFFHQDKSRITVNVAVSADASHTGGRLLGVYGGHVHTILRSEGEATVHSSDLFHGVTLMTEGVRYSLIMFL